MKKVTILNKAKAWIKKREGTPLFFIAFWLHWIFINFHRSPFMAYRYFNKRIHYFRNSLILQKMIKGRRILILGSGPSVRQLKSIPEDVVLMTCNLGGKLLADKNIDRKINFYLSPRGLLSNSDYLLSSLKVDVFAAKKCGIKYLKEHNFFNNPGAVVLYDDSKDHYYLRSIIKPYHYAEITKDVKGESRPWTSSGIRLLQLAIYFKAKEIYLIGIDLSDAHFYSPKEGEEKRLMEEKRLDFNAHRGVDCWVMRYVSRNYSHIFSASPNSPILKYIPFREI